MIRRETPQTPQTPGWAGPAVPLPVTQADTVTVTESGVSLAGMIKPETLFQVHLGVSMIEIDGETIIHDHLRDSNYRLNPSGSFIWSRISPQISFASLLATIREEYDVVPNEIDRMIAEFLAELIDRGLLAASNLGRH